MAGSKGFCETTGKVLAYTVYTCEWIIHDFTLQLQKIQLDDDEISSHNFTIEGCKGSWRIQLRYAKTRTEEKILAFQLHNTVKRDPYVTETKFFVVDARGSKIPMDDRTHVEDDEVNSIGCISLQKVVDSKILLPKGVLTIECKITVLENPRSLAGSESLQLEQSDGTLSHDMAPFFDNMKFGDVTLVAGEREFQAHKSILAARSSVFRAMLEQKMRESEESKVEIEDIDAEVVAEVLRYMYTNRVQNLSAMAVDLLAAADKYGLNGLHVMCEESLLATLNLENAAEIWVMADRHRAWQLKAHVLRFIDLKRRAFVNTEGYKRLEKAYPQLVFEAFRSSDN